MFRSDDMGMAPEYCSPYRGMSPVDLIEEARWLAEERTDLDVREAELLMEVQLQRALGADGFRDSAAWLRHSTGIASSTARTRTNVAAQLAVLPAAQAAFYNLDLGFDHLRVLAEHANSPNRDQVIEQQTDLVAIGVACSADEFRERLAAWARDLDERRDAGLSDHERQRKRRRMIRSRTKDGLARTIFELDDEADAVFYGALRDVMGEMRRADTKAKLPPEQHRSLRQIGADAGEELARRSRGADVITKHRARPTILALTEMSVLWDQLRVNGYCELDNGTKLTSRQLRRLACEADIIPMVMDTNGVCLDMGRSVRLATQHQRLAQRALHPTCAVEGCDVDFDWCEIHHLKPWEKHGFTDLANLVPLCTYHHHWIHDHDGDDPGSLFEVMADRVLRIRRLPIRPAPQRRRPRDLTMGTSPPDLVPTRA